MYRLAGRVASGREPVTYCVAPRGCRAESRKPEDPAPDASYREPSVLTLVIKCPRLPSVTGILVGPGGSIVGPCRPSRRCCGGSGVIGMIIWSWIGQPGVASISRPLVAERDRLCRPARRRGQADR